MPPRSTVPRRTWPGTRPRTWWRRAWPNGSSSRWPTRSARRTRSRSSSRRSAPKRSTRPGLGRRSPRSSTSGRRPSSRRWISAGPSTRRPPATGTSAARASPGRRPTAPRTSAGPSPEPGGVPVDVAVDVPRLELDRPFTYLLPEEHAPGTGLRVSVSFHGRTVRGWVLGPAADVPGRLLPVRRVLSKMALFDEEALRLYRWMSERYVAPLATVIDRAHPPRVASEET